MAHFVLTLFRYFPHGGLQTDFLRILEECRRRGHRISVCCSGWEGPVPENIDLQQIPCRAVSNHRGAWLFQERFRRRMEDLRPDLVLGFNRMAGLDMYFAADSCFAMDHPGGRLKKFLLPRIRIYSRMEEAVFSPLSRTRILALTARQQREYQAVYHTQDCRFRLLPPGISPACRRPDDPEITARARKRIRKEFGIPENAVLLLEIGSGFRTKGVDRNISAWPDLPENVHLLVAGREKKRYFKKLAEALHVSDRVHFAGPRDDVPDLLFAADGMAHPARREAAGNVLAEASAAGLPVIASGVCGYAPLVRSAGGMVLEEPFDQQSWNLLLKKFLEALPECRSRALRYGVSADLYRRAEAVADIMEESLAGNGGKQEQES